jgi:hypothetical protein
MEALPKFLLFNASSAPSAAAPPHPGGYTYSDTGDGNDGSSDTSIDFPTDLPTVSSRDNIVMLS